MEGSLFDFLFSFLSVLVTGLSRATSLRLPEAGRQVEGARLDSRKEWDDPECNRSPYQREVSPRLNQLAGKTLGFETLRVDCKQVLRRRSEPAREIGMVAHSTEFSNYRANSGDGLHINTFISSVRRHALSCGDICTRTIVPKLPTFGL
jgi:hypothetical protein